MKKIILSALVATIALAANSYAGTAIATGNVLSYGNGEQIYGSATASATSDGTLIGRLSKGVGIGIAFSTSGYSVTTKHKTGIKMYGTSFDSTAIYSIDSTSGTAVTAPGAADSSAFGSGWTAM